MSTIKYRVREYNPKTDNQGSHSFFAEVVISNDINNAELSRKIAARTGFKAYECQAIVASVAEVVAEEVLEGSRITLSDEQGTKMVSIYPKVSGSISDKEVQANPEKYEGKTVATKDMLTPDMLDWTVGATVGIKFSQEFEIHKHAQRVEMVAADAPSSSSDEGGTASPDPSQGGGNSGGTGTIDTGGGASPTPSGGGDNGGENDGGD